MGFFDRFRRKRLEVKQYNFTGGLLGPIPTFNAKWSQYSNTEALDSYRKSVWLYDCINLRANNLASVPWVVEVRRGDEWEQSEDHPLAKLIENPNPEIDRLSMFKRAIQWMDLGGDAWFCKIYNGGNQVWEWWPLYPTSMRVIPARPGEGLVQGWQYQDSSTSKTYKAQEIMHWMYPGPGSVYYGLAPLQAAAQSVDTDQEAANFQKVSLQNFGMPPGLFEGPDDLGQSQYEQVKKWIEEQSGPEQAHQPWVLGGFKYHQMGLSPHELDFMESRLRVALEILSAYGTPPPLVGIYTGAGGLNSEIIQTARRIFWMETLIPILREIEAQLNTQLASGFGDDVRITYDLTNVEALQEDRAAKIVDAKGLWAMGIPFEKINTWLELGYDTEDVVGADQGYLPSGLLPTDFDLGEAEPASDGGEEAEAIPAPAPDAPVETTPEGPPPEEPVANTAMNGAQVTALQGIAQAVADGLMPSDTAVQLIMVAFPTITSTQARAIIGPMEGFEQDKPEPPAAPAAKDEEEEEDAE